MTLNVYEEELELEVFRDAGTAANLGRGMSLGEKLLNHLYS